MEVRKSVVFATVIIVLVFVPLLSLSGVAGKLFGPLAIAYISSITASLFVALTITPALCYLMIGYSDIRTEDSPVVKFLKGKYETILMLIEKQSKINYYFISISYCYWLIVFTVSEDTIYPSLARRTFHNAYDLIPWHF
jgi:Cu/Ag efflux pump CusA